MTDTSRTSKRRDPIVRMYGALASIALLASIYLVAYIVSTEGDQLLAAIGGGAAGGLTIQFLRSCIRRELRA